MQPLSTSPDMRSDDVTIVEDDPLSSSRRDSDHWKVLIVDDDGEVHAATRFVLGQAELLGRPLELIEARSSREAEDELLRHPDIAVILLDVVMEEHDSGLKLARWVRDAGFDAVRIILRTGQPGYAPELDVIRDYDINDYRAKSELTQTRLITSMTAALRSFQQIETIDRSRRGLEMIVSSCAQLFQTRELSSFSHGVLLQISSLCGIEGDGLICAANDKRTPSDSRIVSGTGDLANFIDRRLSDLPESNPLKSAALDGMRNNTSTDGPLVLAVDAPPDRRLVAALAHDRPLDTMDAALLQVFAANIAVGFENVGLIERLDRLAYWDESTGLPTRHKLLQDMGGYGTEAAFVALIRVLTYSDTLVAFGQAMATGLLFEVAGALRGVRGTDVYRYGEDVLGLIVKPGSRQEALLGELGQRRFRVVGQDLRVRFAIGCAPLAYRGDAAAACDQAFAAMSIAGKGSGEDIVRFDPSIVRDARKRIELIAGLRAALDDGQVDIAFQPLVNMFDGACLGFEALARWNWAGEQVSPEDFIPLAEQVGLSFEIFTLGLRQSARLLRKLNSAGLSGYASVNLAACDLERSDLVSSVIKQLGELQMAPTFLQIEVTEQSLIQDYDVSERNLRALKALGCRIALDDFGTGYSSLSYIGKLPLDVIKLDRLFIANMAVDPSAEAIVSLTAALSKRLGLEVVAEGVETPEQQSALRAIGLRCGQGYLFAKPMAASQFEAWACKASVLGSRGEMGGIEH